MPSWFNIFSCGSTALRPRWPKLKQGRQATHYKLIYSYTHLLIYSKIGPPISRKYPKSSRPLAFIRGYFCVFFAPLARTFAHLARTFAPLARTFAPLARTFAPLARVFARFFYVFLRFFKKCRRFLLRKIKTYNPFSPPNPLNFRLPILPILPYLAPPKPAKSPQNGNKLSG